MGYQVLIAALVLGAICGLAWLKGGAAERAGAVLLAAVWLWSTLAWVVCREFIRVDLDHTGVVLNLIGDAVLAISFLVLALRFNSLWLGAGMIVQGAEFMFNALYLGDPAASRTVYLARVNVVSLVIQAVLVVATLSAWRRRVRRNKAAGSLAPEVAGSEAALSALLGPPPLPPGAPG